MQLAVLGCGLIGQSWTALFLARGHDVMIWDPSPEARDGMADGVVRPLQQLAELGFGNGSAKGQLIPCDKLEDAVRGAELVQENAPENVPLKQALYAQVEAAASSDTLIASSTSSLVWSELSEGMVHPERFLTAHPFNPPHLMPLVEIYGRDNATVAKAEAFYRDLDRQTVCLKREAVGHIANRLASALWREAVNIVAEGIADVPQVDAALLNGPGLRWSVVGAHMAYHLGGGAGGIAHYLSHLGPSQEKRWSTLGSPNLTPEVCALLVEGVMAEAGGKSISQLETDRDARLIAAINARRS
ncbi:3-hydroxyacyl-CoA dehydrogenase NAD-binding domain-containing protein [Roseovarius atlanticus]|uniref:3-hydroxyacyl-CoA dehydrogenase NAD-binding domain-containing protein n=1 Tax=Roseovarius atlanticus TaxID=1641875 RepID=UPI001C9793F3|nr:3-hydroxyacyl-CoA dehydrogenase NAD-binding domain-containing protein [Roseovarius atlanticus]MBY5989096.1 3-hydroxyacyl-CoA dehydrogenase [Roseovarius atlanticus]MBY6124488.1 3-hydroxyacyl-CoA dehydrogenase [Roseovarius atlanticus]MBY6148983.1 3-hydroxyacyl-CoA dehydrogenase [Roseovarius atlanticus]